MGLTNQQKQEVLNKVKYSYKLKRSLRFEDIYSCTIRYNGKQYTGELLVRPKGSEVTLNAILHNFFFQASELGVADVSYVYHAFGFDNMYEALGVWRNAKKDAEGIKRVFGKDLPLFFSLFDMQVPKNL